MNVYLRFDTVGKIFGQDFVNTFYYITDAEGFNYFLIQRYFEWWLANRRGFWQTAHGPDVNLLLLRMTTLNRERQLRVSDRRFVNFSGINGTACISSFLVARKRRMARHFTTQKTLYGSVAYPGPPGDAISEGRLVENSSAYLGNLAIYHNAMTVLTASVNPGSLAPNVDFTPGIILWRRRPLPIDVNGFSGGFWTSVPLELQAAFLGNLRSRVPGHGR